MLNLSHVIFLGAFIYLNTLHNQITCPPVEINKPLVPPLAEHQPPVTNETLENDPILSLEYHKYLREIVNVLETDGAFKKLIENASVDDIKSGKIANNLKFVERNVRTKLDELKRKEIERLRTLISRRAAIHQLRPDQIKDLMPKHLDHQNVDTFEEGDLEQLIKQATQDLEEVDKLRKEEFKEHEMRKEFDRRQKLKEMDGPHRQKAEEEFQKAVEKRKHHEKVNHPGSKDQLEEVWKEEDKLEPEQFNPRTFFQLHDLDGNQFLDEFEIEALFQNELDKLFNASDPLYDPQEREEEANRMRQHVFTEIDQDKDKMISLKEFIDATQKKEFEKNEEWKSVEDEPQFNEQEFEDYAKHQAEELHHDPSQEQHHPPTPVDHHQEQQNQQHQPQHQP